MKTMKSHLLIVGIIGALLMTDLMAAATEVATFGSFYQEGWSPSWWLAALAAIVAAGAIVVTGGTASPIVVSIGTWVGGLMGFSGVAATNAGLAILGGGSIASGGFGMVGGAALLTAALTFGTEVVFDYGANLAKVAYDQNAFVEASTKMTQLPLPVNRSGPPSVKAAMEVLQQADSKKPLYSPQNQVALTAAIESLNVRMGATSNDLDLIREHALLALLSYLKGDYRLARESASSAYSVALQSNQRPTLPAFVFSVSELFETQPNVNRAYDYFAYAVTNEQDNDLRPILFAAFLDRATYRMDDGAVPTALLDRLYRLSQPFNFDQRKGAVQLGIVSRYFIQLKLAQQKIIALTGTRNEAIKNHPQTLKDVQSAFKTYERLLAQSKWTIDSQQREVSLEVNNNVIHTPKWQQQWLDQLQQHLGLWQSYRDGSTALAADVAALERYQAALDRKQITEGKGKQDAETSSRAPYMGFILVLLIVVMIVGFSLSRRKTSGS